MSDHLKIRDILNEREQTHGTFLYQATTAQDLKDTVLALLCREASSNRHLDAVMKEAMELILTKISRIAHGNPRHRDAWADICGYAQLVVDQLDEFNYNFEVAHQPKAASSAPVSARTAPGYVYYTDK